MTPTVPRPASALIEAAKSIAANIASTHAADVDSKARFPIESVTAAKQAKLMSALVPKELGGGGCTMRELGEICSALAQGCSSSGMVLAMHYSQLACLVRHGMSSDSFRAYLKEIVEHQYLLASITSEVGTAGDTRSSICAVETVDGRFTLNKEATTGSYCAHADAILVTCKKDAAAANSDQVLVLAKQGDYTLTQTTTWDTMGMRGTCSPGFSFKSSGPASQIVPGSFADSSAQSMVPYSHILWSSLWCGIATDAIVRAGAFVRAEARKKPGTVPPGATRLAEASEQLQALRHNWMAVANEFDQIDALPNGREELMTIGWALKMNNLKVNASETAPLIVHKALQIIGVMGYKNDSKLSVARHYRDALSAALMISNDRILAKSASMLLVLKDTQ
jgi:acyl-CoA dehydrogenase